MTNLTVFATELAACWEKGSHNGISTFLSSSLWVNYGSKLVVLVGIFLLFKGMWGLASKLLGKGKTSLSSGIGFLVGGVGLLAVGNSTLLNILLEIFDFVASFLSAGLEWIGITC